MTITSPTNFKEPDKMATVTEYAPNFVNTKPKPTNNINAQNIILHLFVV